MTIHDRADPGPASGGNEVKVDRRKGSATNHVSTRRRRGTGHPVQRLVHLRKVGHRELQPVDLPECHHGFPKVLPRPRRAKAGCDGSGIEPTPYESVDELAQVRIPTVGPLGKIAGEVEVSTPTRRAGPGQRPRCDGVRPQLEPGQRRNVVGHLEVRLAAQTARSDRQHVPIDPRKTAQQRVAPRADPAQHVRIRPLGREENVRVSRAARGHRPSATSSWWFVGQPPCGLSSYSSTPSWS